MSCYFNNYFLQEKRLTQPGAASWENLWDQFWMALEGIWGAFGGDDDFRGWGCDFTNLSSPTSIANFFLGVLKTRNRQTQEPLFPLQDSLCPSPDEAFDE